MLAEGLRYSFGADADMCQALQRLVHPWLNTADLFRVSLIVCRSRGNGSGQQRVYCADGTIAVFRGAAPCICTQSTYHCTPGLAHAKLAHEPMRRPGFGACTSDCIQNARRCSVAVQMCKGHLHTLLDVV